MTVPAGANNAITTATTACPTSRRRRNFDSILEDNIEIKPTQIEP